MEEKNLLQEVDRVLRPQDWNETKQQRAYGDPLGNPPGLGNEQDPLDELIFIYLSQQVELEQAMEAYRRLREDFPVWEQVLDAPKSDVAKSINTLPRFNVKVEEIQGILDEVRSESEAEGFDLEFLKTKPNEEVYDWLTKPKGIGPKTAHCVMLFSLDRNVLPVDTHIHRILNRLSLVSPASKLSNANKTIQQFVPENSAFSLHVNLLEHGKCTCKKSCPECDECYIESLCAYAGHHVLDIS